MRRCAPWTLWAALWVVTSWVLTSSEALAQRGPGGFGGRGGGGNSLFLLTQKSVQDELKLSAEQITKIEGELESQRGALAGLRDLAPDERRQKLEERAAATQAFLRDALQEDQFKRFRQIDLQQRGPIALADPQIAEALKLAAEQKDRITAIQRASEESMREIFQEGAAGGDRDSLRAKADELRSASNDKVLAVLSAEQQSQWKALLGEPFKGEIRRGRRGPAG